MTPKIDEAVDLLNGKARRGLAYKDFFCYRTKILKHYSYCKKDEELVAETRRALQPESTSDYDSKDEVCSNLF